jgi:rubrerythrin
MTSGESDGKVIELPSAEDNINSLPGEGFDLDKYLRASKRVDLSSVEWNKIADHPLPEEHARCLTYMMDIETHTSVFLRDLLATRATFDPDVTAFLSCWAYEELWHGEAFSRFLGEAGYTIPPRFEDVSAGAEYPSRTPRNTWIRRKIGTKGYVSHVATLISSAFLRDFVAVHMTWGAANELSTLQGYFRLIDRSEHPQLIAMLRAIIKDERRHFAFYRAQARVRLAHSKQARNATRYTMEHIWAPVGTGVRPQSETDFVVDYLFGSREDAPAVKEMDDTMESLPGLGNLGLFRNALSGAKSRLRL